MSRSQSRLSSHYYTKQFLCDCDLLDKCSIPVYVSFLEHTWQPESKQKCKAPNACCEIYALKLLSFTYGQTVWVFHTSWFYFYFTHNFIVLLFIIAHTKLLINTNPPDEWFLSLGCTSEWLKEFLKIPVSRLCPYTTALHPGVILSFRAHLATSCDVFGFYSLLGGY